MVTERHLPFTITVGWTIRQDFFNHGNRELTQRALGNANDITFSAYGVLTSVP